MLAGSLVTRAQSIKGTLMDPVEGVVVKDATVQLAAAADSNIVASTISDASGSFLFRSLPLGNYILKASSVGFEPLALPVSLTDSLPDLDLDDVYIPKKTTTLEGVVIVASAPAVSQKGDTSQFSASHFKTNPDATVEDLIKKMPGITVDRAGNVTAQGEEVKKVTVNGKDFFGEDATMAIRNLPSEIVDKIQVFDRLSDQAQLTGFDDGNSVKAINIVTKSEISKNGQFGRIYAGYGTDERYAAGGNVSFFNGDRQLAFVGNFNNVNQQNFASQDLLGVSGGGGGGGGRGGRGGGGNFTVGQQDGISRTNALGVNFSDKWGSKFDIAASYFFNNSRNTNESESYRQTTLSQDSILYTGNKSLSNSDNFNHRLNMRMEYKIDSNNTIYIIPSVSFQNRETRTTSSSYSYYNDLDSINNAAGNSVSDRHGYNIDNHIMYRHSFAKRGRSLSLGLRNSWTRNDGNSNNYNQLRYYDAMGTTDSLLNQTQINNTNGSRLSARASYTEPVGRQGQFEIEYEYEIQKNKADQQTHQYDEDENEIFQPEFSNKFDNNITTNTAELNYRLGRSRDNQFSVGVDLQNSRLESARTFPTSAYVDQHFNAILPSLRWSKKIGRNSNFRLFYRARTDFPSVNQLQDVVTISGSTLNVSSGNPALKQSYSNYASFRYSYIDRKSGKSFFANIFGQLADNYITNATYIPSADSVIQNGIVVKKGSQFVKPINMNGYKNINAFLNYSIPVNWIKSNINLNAGLSYSDQPGLINYLRTKTTSTTYRGGVVWASNISEYVDFNLSYSANFNNSINTANDQNNRYVNQEAGLFLNLLSKSGWFLQNDVRNQNYSGLSESYNQSYWLWNAAIGKKFLKKQAGELKLSVFDLLKQNQSISRTVQANYIEDAQNRVLQQYFMLTFTYSLRNFGKGKAASSTEATGGRDWRGGPPPGGGSPRGGGRGPGGPMF
ncbi:TonB-dependent receptor [Niabella terrae]